MLDVVRVINRIKPEIVVLDVDGVLVSSPLSKITSSGYASRFLAQMPTLKKIALGMFEIGEIAFKTEYEMNDGTEKVCYDWDIPYMGIITDRSLRGLLTALGKNTSVLARMKFVQVRKSTFGSSDKLPYEPELWETKSVKPDESVFYRLVEFTKSKNIPPYNVLIIDDDSEFRFVAKSRFGFTVYPDDTKDIKVREERSFFRQHAIAPAY